MFTWEMLEFFIEREMFQEISKNPFLVQSIHIKHSIYFYQYLFYYLLSEAPEVYFCFLGFRRNCWRH